MIEVQIKGGFEFSVSATFELACAYVAAIDPAEWPTRTMGPNACAVGLAPLLIASTTWRTDSPISVSPRPAPAGFALILGFIVRVSSISYSAVTSMF